MSAINSMAAVSASNSTQLTEDDKKRIVEDESRRLEQLKVALSLYNLFYIQLYTCIQYYCPVLF